MKSASPALVALLNSGGPYLMADLLTVTLVGGGVLRLTSSDMDVTYNGNTYSSKGPFFERGKTRTVIGVEVDTLDLKFIADGTMMLNGQPFLQALRMGALDGATIQLERAFMASWGDTSAGTVILFYGSVSDVTVGRTEAQVAVKSLLELLNIQMPRNLYQPPCGHTLYDTGCGVSKGAKGVNSTAASGSTASVINCGLVQAQDYFSLGSVLFTSGANAGLSRTVKSYTPGVLTLINPLPGAPGVGDAFTAYPGCDRQQATCSSKFANLTNFRGCPYIPVPETAI